MKKVCLIIIDGFGVAPPGPGNARSRANMPTVTKLEETVPHCLMDASGEAVGLTKGQQGTSEAGHLTIGAGRVVWQPLEVINRSIASGEFFENEVLTTACDRAKKKGVIHLLGIYSTGNVHGSIEHYHAMMQMAKNRGVERAILHLIGDGRDVSEQYFCTDFDLLKPVISKEKFGIIASLIGRYFAMDRDRNYEKRTKIAYDLLTQGKGEEVDDFCEGARQWYLKAPQHEKTDYYIRPLKMPDFVPLGAEDTLVCVNFRSDRMMQIVRALEDETFTEFERPVRIKDVVCMGPYSHHLPVAFPAKPVTHKLGRIISEAGLKQLRLAETDKYAHVTFFFNAQKHDPYEGEDRIMIDSPKVPNYADAPAMSADALTDELMKQLQSGTYHFIVANFANCDLVGHGGQIDAAIAACEAVDRNLARLLPALASAGYEWIITADHGNAEEMYLPGTEMISPSHTTNKVQTFVHSDVIASSNDLTGLTGLKDIAPLVLRMMGIPAPKEMR
jgi:2,3-bisphosphoglycerate-independent phosphoglycerate mutase